MRQPLPATIGIVALALALCGCANGPAPGMGSASPTGASSASVAAGPGAMWIFHQDGGAQRHSLAADGSVGPATDVPWESGPDAEATLFKDATGRWALTSTVELPLTDVSRTTELQVRDVATGEVVQRVAVDGWCSGPDGASYPCLLLDRDRMVRTSPLMDERDGTVTMTSLPSGDTLAEFGPFPGLVDVAATAMPDLLVLTLYDAANGSHRALQLDVTTGQTTEIGTRAAGSWICVLGTDSVLTYDGALAALGPAPVAAVAVPELEQRGPGPLGCSTDGRYLYLYTDRDLGQPVPIDALTLADGSRRAAVVTVPANSVARVTR